MGASGQWNGRAGSSWTANERNDWRADVNTNASESLSGQLFSMSGNIDWTFLRVDSGRASWRD